MRGLESPHHRVRVKMPAELNTTVKVPSVTLLVPPKYR